VVIGGWGENIDDPKRKIPLNLNKCLVRYFQPILMSGRFRGNGHRVVVEDVVDWVIFSFPKLPLSLQEVKTVFPARGEQDPAIGDNKVKFGWLIRRTRVKVMKCPNSLAEDSAYNSGIVCWFIERSQGLFETR
jgi:hypothetical protein